MDTLGWLLESDPAIRWQAMRDLTDASPAVLRVERNRVASEGLGAEILVYQQPDGGWCRDNAPVWVTTLFTLQLLRATRVDRANPVVDAAAARVEAGLRWNDQGGWWELRPVETGGNTLFEGEVLTVAYLRSDHTSVALSACSQTVSLPSSSRTAAGKCEAPNSKRSGIQPISKDRLTS